MKILKVIIRRVTDPTKPRMSYPDVYKAEEVDRSGVGVLAYSKAMSRGSDTEECIICVEDSIADKYLTDSDITELTQLQAEALVSQWDTDNNEPIETVNDVNRLIAIQAKKAAGITLTQNDLDALDPDSSVKGIVHGGDYGRVKEKLTLIAAKLIQ